MFKVGDNVIVKHGTGSMVVELTGGNSGGGLYTFTGRYFGLVRGDLVEATINWIPEDLILGKSTISARDSAKPIAFR